MRSSWIKLAFFLQCITSAKTCELVFLIRNQTEAKTTYRERLLLLIVGENLKAHIANQYLHFAIRSAWRGLSGRWVGGGRGMYPNDSFTYFEKTAISREFQPLSIGGNTYTHVRMGNTVTCSLAQTHEHQCAVRVRKRHVMAVLTAQDKNQLQPAWVRARGRERAQERERERAKNRWHWQLRNSR